MARYSWTIGGGMSPASSITELKEFYYRAGNMQNSFRAFELDDQGRTKDITSQIASSGKAWWQFWK